MVHDDNDGDVDNGDNDGDQQEEYMMIIITGASDQADHDDWHGLLKSCRAYAQHTGWHRHHLHQHNHHHLH